MNAQDNFSVNATPVNAAQADWSHRQVIVWSGVIAGALVAFGLTFLLQIFDKALGIQIFKTATEGMAEGMVWGGFIASIIGIIVSMFFAGWVAGHIAKYQIFHNNFFARYAFTRHYGLLYGLLTWCLGLILSLAFITHMGMSHHNYSHRSANPSLSVVSMNTQQTASEMTESNTQRGDSSANNANNPDDTNMASDTSPNPLALSLFLTFLLFFLGAVASCFGGYCGLKPCREDELNPGRTPVR
jgi:hypothetical protein